MATKTEELEINLQKARQKHFITARRILDCLEAARDKKACLSCDDFSLCWKYRDLMGKENE